MRKIMAETPQAAKHRPHSETTVRSHNEKDQLSGWLSWSFDGSGQSAFLPNMISSQLGTLARFDARLAGFFFGSSTGCSAAATCSASSGAGCSTAGFCAGAWGFGRC